MMASVVARQLERAAEEVRAALDAAGAGEADQFHAARLVIKRVRALLVPWLQELPELPALYRTLSAAQDRLGDHRDALRLAARARRFARRVARRTPTQAAGCLALAAHLDDRASALSPLRAAALLEDNGDDAITQVMDAARALDEIARDGHEIERKYLLRSAPPAGTGAAGHPHRAGVAPGGAAARAAASQRAPGRDASAGRAR